MEKSYFKAILAIIVIFVLVTFGVKNSQAVDISYFFKFLVNVPLYAVVYACLIIGIVVGMLVGFSHRWGTKKELKQARKENYDLLKELEDLRAKTQAASVAKEPAFTPGAQFSNLEMDMARDQDQAQNLY